MHDPQPAGSAARAGAWAWDTEARQHFHEKGYIVVPAALDAQHVARLNELYDRAVEEEVEAEAYGKPLVWHGFAKPEWPRKLWGEPYCAPAPSRASAPRCAP